MAAIVVVSTMLVVLTATLLHLARPELSRTHCERRADELRGGSALVSDEVDALSEYLDACFE